MKTLTKILSGLLITGIMITGLYYYLDKESVSAYPSQQGLVAHWKLDDNLGTTVVIDETGVNNGVAQQNTDALSQVSLHQRALTFNGISDYVNCGNDPSLNITDAITIEAWVKTSYEGIQRVVDKYAANDYSYTFRVLANQKLDFYLWIGGVEGKTSTGTINLGEWNHIVVVYDNSNYVVNFYINGIDAGTGTFSDAPSMGTADLWIGARSGNATSNSFNGSIDGVKIYSRALSAEEIQLNYWLGSETRLKNCVLKNCTIH